MPVFVEPIAEEKLSTLEEVRGWVRDVQKHLRRIPVTGILKNNACFYDDEYLGDGEVMFRFNDHGFRAFCQRIGFRFDQLAMLETPALASQVLNDLIQQDKIKAKLQDEEFVLDISSNIIIGMVPHSYVGYSNEQFLTDISTLLNSLPFDDPFEFHDAYNVNTELTLRFTSQKRHGSVCGRGGESPDRSTLGLNCKNSMVGTSSVQINYFLYRLACANGMMVPAGSSINRVFHSGRQDTFQSRLKQCFTEVTRKLDWLQTMLDALGALPFKPEKLAATDAINERIFDIIPGSKQTICDQKNLHLRYPGNCSEAEKRCLKREHDAHIIACIPDCYGGEDAGRVFQSQWRDHATIFDFVNVFTEYAKGCPVAQKLDIEEKTGALAKYIAENARKF